MYDLIWDPWWFTEEKQATNDPEQVILWGCGPGFIVRSEDAAKNWEDVTVYLTDPPNDWTDSPAPTAADLTYKQIHADIHHKDTFYVLAEWQNTAGSWRGWLLKTADDGKTWIWQALGSGGISQTYAFDSDADGWTFESGDDPGNTGVWDGTIGRTANGSLKTSLVAVAANDARWRLSAADGLVVRTGDTLSGYVRHNGDATGNHYVAINFTDATQVQGNVIHGDGNWQQSNLTIGAGDDGKVISKLLVNNNNGAGGAATDGWWDDVAVSIAGESIRPIAIDVDTEDGSRLYVTVWDSTNLALRVFNSSLALQRTYSLGAASEAEVTLRTYFVVPRTPHYPEVADFGDYCYVFGRWSEIGTGTVWHLARSIDAGVSLTNIGDGTWTTERVGGLLVGDSGNEIYAFLNAGSPALWRIQDAGGAWSNINSLPFDLEFEAVSRHGGDSADLLIGNKNASSVQGAWLNLDYDQAWYDATGPAGQRLPTLADGGGGITSIIWIT